jgi:hypothetical protein
MRSERAVWLIPAEMVVHGVSTRKAAALVEEMLGFEVSSTTLSRAAQDLDETLRALETAPRREAANGGAWSFLLSAGKTLPVFSMLPAYGGTR